MMLIIALIVSIHRFLLPEIDFWGKLRPHYNNYLIFKHSFIHLLDHNNLYIFYSEEYGDLFKYSPTFAVFMGLFYYLPDILGIILFSSLSVICYYSAINLLPEISDKVKAYIILFGLIEFIGNLQNLQTNALMAGLIILSFSFFEKKKLWLAALVIALSVYIKLFGIVACALFLLYPNKFRFIAFFIFWMVALLALPLVFVNPEDLINQYINWFHLLEMDHANRYGFSVMGFLQKWFHIGLSKWYVLFVGALLFSLVYIRKDLFKDYGFRLLMLASILIWVVIFNHAAESSGYVICMAGIGIWYFIQERNLLNLILVIAAFLLVSLIYSDITPVYYKHTYLYPYYIKTIPVIVIWVRILYEMIFRKYHFKAMN